MLRRTSETVASSRPEPVRTPSRLRLYLQRAAFAWRAMRFGRGRSVSLKRDGDLVRVEDGARSIYVPNIRRAGVFKNGIDVWLGSVAAKYVGGTGYAPREGDVVLDVGAGIGEFAIWCASTGARVIAFEPDPLAFACLEKNTAGLNVEIYPYAMWKERANLRLHGSPDTSESSLIEDGKPKARNSDVEAWPLDALQFLVRLAVIDLMKVDGEGVEPEILAGAIRTLRKTRVIAVDIGATERRPKLRARVEAALGDMGFRPIPTDREETILALNTAMVGPFSNRVLGRHDS